MELFLGFRYIRARRSQHFISFISLISMLGIGVGVAALIVVISVMNGFGNELRARLLSLSSHVTITAAGGKELVDWREVAALAQAYPVVAGAAPFVEGEGMLVNGLNLSGVLVNGVAPEMEHEVSEIGSAMRSGRLEDLEAGEYRIILGAALANIVGVRAGDRVNLMIPRSGEGAQIVPRLRRFTVSGIFEAGIQEHDTVRALVHIQDAATLFGLPEGVGGLRLKLSDLFAAPRIRDALAAQLGAAYSVTDWSRQQASYFRAIRIEKTMMFVILSLIVAVAAFNIVATLVMVVTDKRTDIAILRTMGLRPGSVMSVFMVQGVVIGLVGTLLGVALGVLLALNVETLVPGLESLLGVQLIPADVYYVTAIPSDMRWSEVGGIAITAFLLAAGSTLYPAWRASRTQPAEALRYD